MPYLAVLLTVFLQTNIVHFASQFMLYLVATGDRTHRCCNAVHECIHVRSAITSVMDLASIAQVNFTNQIVYVLAATQPP